MESQASLPAVKVSLRLDPRLFAAIEKHLEQGREISEVLTEIILQHALAQGWVDPALGEEFGLKKQLVAEAVETALALLRDQTVCPPDIINRAFDVCRAKKPWLTDYEKFVGDNPYRNGNPRKRLINREIGLRIRQGIGGEVDKIDGIPIKVPVTGSIIQSYTKMKSCTAPLKKKAS
jgi:hypothetical protein